MRAFLQVITAKLFSQADDCPVFAGGIVGGRSNPWDTPLVPIWQSNPCYLAIVFDEVLRLFF